jgi:hypothetical protein
MHACQEQRPAQTLSPVGLSNRQVDLLLSEY